MSERNIYDFTTVGATGGSATPTTTSATIVAANEGRVFLHITRTDTNSGILYLHLGSGVAEDGKGIPLTAKGSNIFIEGWFYRGAVKAIMSTGTGTISYEEA